MVGIDMFSYSTLGMKTITVMFIGGATGVAGGAGRSE